MPPLGFLVVVATSTTTMVDSDSGISAIGSALAVALAAALAVVAALPLFA